MGNSFRNIATVMLVAGALLKKPPITVFGAFLLGVALLSYLVSRLALDEVTYKRKLSSRVAFSGDSVELTVTVENKKPLAVPLVCDDEIPRSWDMPAKSAKGHPKPGRGWLRNEMAIGGFETVTRKFTISCPSRGVYSVGPVNLSSGDPFGLYPVSTEIAEPQSLTVYPRIVPVEEPPGRSIYPFGTARAPSWTYQDPSMLKMVREYAPGDSMRHIDWKATARSGRLQTRVFDATFGNRVVVCLDLATSRAAWEGTDKEVFESLAVTTASLCSYFHHKGFAVGLASNGVSQGSEGTRLAQCPPATGESQLASILSSLAGLGYYTFGTASAACKRTWIASAGSFPVLVTALRDESTLALLKDLRKNAPAAAVIIVELESRKTRAEESMLGQVFAMPRVQAMIGRLEGGWDYAESLVLSPLE